MNLPELKEQIEKLPDEKERVALPPHPPYCGCTRCNVGTPMPGAWKREDKTLPDIKKRIDVLVPHFKFVCSEHGSTCDPHITSDDVQKLSASHTALERRVAQYEEMLALVATLDTDWDICIGKFNGKWNAQSYDEDGSILAESGYKDSVLEAWNALKGGGSETP